MFASIYLAAAQAAENYKARLRDEERLKALPQEQFDREMRIREVRALEEQARNPPKVNVKTSIF